MSAEERLEALRQYADDGLRYYATAYHRISSLTRDQGDDLRTIMNEMTRMAHVMALIEGNEGRAAMEAREAIVERYLSETASGRVVWSPEAGITTEEELVRKVASQYGLSNEDVEFIRGILTPLPRGVAGHRAADVVRIAHWFGVSPLAFAEFVADQTS
jgi:hypothetical protein